MVASYNLRGNDISDRASSSNGFQRSTPRIAISDPNVHGRQEVLFCSEAIGDRKTDGTFCSTICTRCLHNKNMCSKYFRTFRSLYHVFGKFRGYFMVNVRLQSGHLFLSIKGEWCLYSFLVETITACANTLRITIRVTKRLCECMIGKKF